MPTQFVPLQSMPGQEQQQQPQLDEEGQEPKVVLSYSPGVSVLSSISLAIRCACAVFAICMLSIIAYHHQHLDHQENANHKWIALLALTETFDAMVILSFLSHVLSASVIAFFQIDLLMAFLWLGIFAGYMSTSGSRGCHGWDGKFPPKLWRSMDPTKLCLKLEAVEFFCLVLMISFFVLAVLSIMICHYDINEFMDQKFPGLRQTKVFGLVEKRNPQKDHEESLAMARSIYISVAEDLKAARQLKLQEQEQQSLLQAQQESSRREDFIRRQAYESFQRGQQQPVDVQGQPYGNMNPSQYQYAPAGPSPVLSDQACPSTTSSQLYLGTRGYPPSYASQPTAGVNFGYQNEDDVNVQIPPAVYVTDDYSQSPYSQFS